MGRYTLKEKISYWFDNLMARGTLAKIRLLLVDTLIFIVVIGLLGGFASNGSLSFDFHVLWKTFMYSIGKGTLDHADGTPIYVILMLVAIFYSIFFTSILIGLISTGIRNKIDSLAKGRSRVLESGHTIVLGFNDVTFVLLKELILANENQQVQQKVVVLGAEDRAAMEEAVHARFGRTRNHPKTKIICRTGSIYDFEDLRRISIESSSAIIVNGSTDFETVKSIIACSYLLETSSEDCSAYAVGAIHDNENLFSAEVTEFGRGTNRRLELLPLEETLARIMVHTSRQPGMSDVFVELLNYEDNEFYIVKDDPAFSSLYGKNIADINCCLESAYAVGVCKAFDGVVIDSPDDVLFEQGDYLIVVEEDDDALKVSSVPHETLSIGKTSEAEQDATCILILGNQPMLGLTLGEYADYLHCGSRICIADLHVNLDDIVDEKTRGELEDRGITLEAHEADLSRRSKLNHLLDQVKPDCVLVLIDHDTENQEEDDEKTVRLVLNLREYRSQRGANFSITSEMHTAQNRNLVATTGPEDFIIGRHISALLLVQIAQQREMRVLFDSLLQSEGYEVYMKRASCYLPLDTPVDLFSVGRAVATRKEIFIGYRLMRDGVREAPIVCPRKIDMATRKPIEYSFGKDDYLVVLADGPDFEA